MWRTAIVSPRFGSSITTGTLDHRTGAEDRDLGLVDDRGVEERPEAAQVGDREGAAGELVRADLVGAGALGDVGDLLGQPGDRQVAGVLDDRGEQALLGVHREREVLAVEVGDLALLGVDRRVELGVLP